MLFHILRSYDFLIIFMQHYRFNLEFKNQFNVEFTIYNINNG